MLFLKVLEGVKQEYTGKTDSKYMGIHETVTLNT